MAEWLADRQVLIGTVSIVLQAVVFSLLPVWI